MEYAYLYNGLEKPDSGFKVNVESEGHSRSRNNNFDRKD